MIFNKGFKNLSTSKKIFIKSTEEPFIPSNSVEERRDFCHYGAWQYIGIHLQVNWFGKHLLVDDLEKCWTINFKGFLV